MTAAVDAQAAVDEFFDRDAGNWYSIYDREDVFSVIHQRRQRTALAWIHELALPAGSRVLEVGCGAGLLAVAMARARLDVVATDSVGAMIELARANATRHGVRLTLRQVDVHHLNAGSGMYDLVVALGVVPWLHSPDLGLAAMSRVLRPGGFMIVNADNKARLQSWLDPLYAPPLAPVRRGVQAVLHRGRRVDTAMPSTIRHSVPEFDAALSRVALTRVRGETFGFGPFTLLGRRVLREKASVRMHLLLQALADRHLPLLRSTGAQYIVLARKGQVPG